MDTYSPFAISMWMPASAWVSTSSVKKTLVTPSSLISACLGSAIVVSSRISGVALLQPDAVVRVVGRHVGENHLVPDIESGQHFDHVDRVASELDLHAFSRHAVFENLEQPDGALLLPERGPAHVDDVVHLFELHRAVD